MHWIDVLIGAIALVAAGLAARSLWRAADLPTSLRLALALVAGLGTALIVLGAAALWLKQPWDPWNAARLAPAVALHHGYTLYYPLETGPVLSTVVGPMAFLAYWPVGFLRGSPTTLILVAGALNLIVFGLIAHALFRRAAADAAACWLAFLVLFQLALHYPSLRYSLFCIHADAPALAFTAIGLVLLAPASSELSWRRAAAAALCFVLAVWAKQSLALIFVAVPVALVMRDGWRTALRLILASAGVGVVVSLGFVAWFGFDTLRLNMFAVPARHPWLQMNLADGEIYRGVTAHGTAAHVKVAFAAMLNILRGSWPLFALFAALFAERFFRRAPGETWWPRQRWALFAAAAFALLPTAAIGRVKVGGEANHESFSVYFLVIAFACWLIENDAIDRRLRLIRVGCVAAVLLVLGAPRVLEYRGWNAAWNNQNERSYDYARAHPGHVYFPWNPLSSLLAEHKLYHFDYGVYDRNLGGGAHVTASHLEQALPAPRPLIASTIAHHNYILNTYFPDYESLPADPELGGWKLYGPPPR